MKKCCFFLCFLLGGAAYAVASDDPWFLWFFGFLAAGATATMWPGRIDQILLNNKVLKGCRGAADKGELSVFRHELFVLSHTLWIAWALTSAQGEDMVLVSRLGMLLLVSIILGQCFCDEYKRRECSLTYLLMLFTPGTLLLALIRPSLLQAHTEKLLIAATAMSITAGVLGNGVQITRNWLARRVRGISRMEVTAHLFRLSSLVVYSIAKLFVPGHEDGAWAILIVAGTAMSFVLILFAQLYIFPTD